MFKRWAALPPTIRWLVGIAVVVLALAVVRALFVPAADWLADHDVGPVTGPLHERAVDNARGRLLTLGAGLLAAGALVFTALNFRLLRRNSEQADQWQRRTYELTEQGQVTDRYTKAIDQLGSYRKLDVRIGGIYALERVAHDSARDHPIVIEVLAAFIREHSHEQWPPSDHPDSQGQERSSRPPSPWSVAGILAAIPSGSTSPGAYLDGTDLTGANLRGANLTRADLTDADLGWPGLGRPDLTDADLNGAVWPGGAGIPEGWTRDPDSRRLGRPADGWLPEGFGPEDVTG